MAQLTECRRDFESRIGELSTKLADQKAKNKEELAEKEGRMREAANLLLGGFGGGAQGVVLGEVGE